MKPFRIFCALACLLFWTSCSEFNKLRKNPDLEFKYKEAVRFYEKGDCLKSAQLLEELVPVYKGTPKAEMVYYYYAFSHYCMGDYLMASYHFRTFVRTFPTSKHAEECGFMGAYCYFLESPRYSLDQTDTKNAIRELQGFILRFPGSTRLDSCNKLIDKLRDKLEKKNFEIAQQLFHMEDYRGAIVSFNNLLKEFPDTRYREKISFLILKSSFEQASRSIDDKKIARLESTLDLQEKFVTTYGKGPYANEAAQIGKLCVTLIEKEAFNIPKNKFDAGKYSDAIKGFREFIRLYPSSGRKDDATNLISQSYFLMVQKNFLSIEKSYGVNNVIKAYKDFESSRAASLPLIPQANLGQLETITEQAPGMALRRVYGQLKDAIRLEDVYVINYLDAAEQFFKETIDKVKSSSERKSLEDDYATLPSLRVSAMAKLPYWYFEAGMYEKARERFSALLPVTTGQSKNSKAALYYLKSMYAIAENKTVFNPDGKKVVLDSLVIFHKSIAELLVPKYKKKAARVLKDALEMREELPVIYAEALLESRQFEKTIEYSLEQINSGKVSGEVLRELKYIHIKARYEFSKVGFKPEKVKQNISDAREAINAYRKDLSFVEKLRAGKMSRKLKKRANR